MAAVGDEDDDVSTRLCTEIQYRRLRGNFVLRNRALKSRILDNGLYRSNLAQRYPS